MNERMKKVTKGGREEGRKEGMEGRKNDE